MTEATRAKRIEYIRQKSHLCRNRDPFKEAISEQLYRHGTDWLTDEQLADMAEHWERIEHDVMREAAAADARRDQP